ncbi:spermatogenesis-associated protein 17 isoform X2 [Eublepharis macularius]|uniref:Spermatogenesis-associated protein 17 isoform X2 n=1 Tax=Eublepharis macularius TaxID=481883 RepID=A0AA97JM37_EUBMA|nr:spermatogenesis-associated protein 17 isoform X2 [Eublepharis macularius]
MATLVRLQGRLPGFKEGFFQRNRCVDEYRQMEYYAAVKIQSWFRGCKVRAYIRYLNKMMIFIQKWWRGYQGRKQFRKMVETAYFIMKMNFYNEMAVRIQKRWRGYYIRKYIHNYYALKKYLEAISLNNEMVRRGLDEFAEMKEREEEKQALEREEKKKDYQARKMHYLLSTQQGPFRDAAEVLQQRLKPFEPSMRVAASSASLEEAREKVKQEEWRNRVHDDEFFPFASCHKPYKYIPSMQRSSKYGKENYGLKYFREQHTEKWITNKDFITAVPPIHLFEKFGKTYSRAGEIV